MALLSSNSEFDTRREDHIDDEPSKRPLLASKHSYNGQGTFVSVHRQAYTPISSYEGFHRYDPDYTWSDDEEQRLVRQIDLRICTWICVAFFALQLDRTNIVQAVSDDMLPDLGLTTNNYNTGQMIFFLSFLFAELPSQLISKKIGPDNWIPIQMVLWSVVASSQAFLSGRTSFYICRALVGSIEGGFVPDTILYLSYWYTSKELPRRLSYFWTAYQLTSIIGAFLAAGILSMRGIRGVEGWRWLFAIEGIITGLIGIATYFYLPPSPTQTASRLRGKSWFSDHEEKILVNRILRDDPSKGDMHNRQAVTPKLLWQALTDWEMWPIYIIGPTFLVPTLPPTQYLTLILKQSFTTLQVNLLTIPSSIIFIANLLWTTWLSEKLNQRLLVALLSQIWMLPCLIALELLPATANRWTKFTLTTLLVGTPYVHAINYALTSRNAGSVRTRTVATALYNMCVQAGTVYSTNIYREADAPMYRTGNKILLAITAWNCVVFVAAKKFYVWRNSAREGVWRGMGREERERYLRETKDRGNKMLTFRFAS